MAKRAGAYRSEKRKKELKRLKKQEEKRLKRQGKATDSEEAEGEGLETSGDHEGQAPAEDEVAQSEAPKQEPLS